MRTPNTENGRRPRTTLAEQAWLAGTGEEDRKRGIAAYAVHAVLAAVAAQPGQTSGAGRARRCGDGSILIVSEDHSRRATIEVAATPLAANPGETKAILDTLLLECGAELVTCRRDGRPNQLGTSTESVRSHAMRGGLIGIVPASIALAVVERAPDAPPGAQREAVATTGRPLGRATGADGSTQLFYRQGRAGADATGRWRHGRIIHDGVAVTLWNPERAPRGRRRRRERREGEA